MRSLIDEIAHSIMAPAVKKGIFSRPHVPFGRYLGCYQEAFEMGVVLGYSFRHKLDSFAKLFSVPGREPALVTYIHGLARERLKEASNAKTFFELAMFAEEYRIKASLEGKGITGSVGEYPGNRLRMPLEQAFKNLYVAVSIGIGFGSAFPELTEQLWKTEHERRVTRAELARLRTAGLDIPEEPEEPVTLAARIEQLLPFVELFVSNYRPELLTEFRQMRLGEDFLINHGTIAYS